MLALGAMGVAEADGVVPEEIVSGGEEVEAEVEPELSRPSQINARELNSTRAKHSPSYVVYPPSLEFKAGPKPSGLHPTP